MGWSMTKGVTNALVGVLVKQGRLNVFSLRHVDGWQEDERSKITVENLLRMNSGLKWWEWYGGPSDATRMLYKEKDMGGLCDEVEVGASDGRDVALFEWNGEYPFVDHSPDGGDSDYYKFSMSNYSIASGCIVR